MASMDENEIRQLEDRIRERLRDQSDKLYPAKAEFDDEKTITRQLFLFVSEVRGKLDGLQRSIDLLGSTQAATNERIGAIEANMSRLHIEITKIRTDLPSMIASNVGKVMREQR